MAMYASVGGNKSFEPPPEGVHLAVCVDVIDLGMIANTKYGKDEHKIQLVFELDPESGNREDGRPFILSRRFTLSMHEKSRLRAFVTSWRGKVFTDDEAAKLDIESLIGKSCQLSVSHRAGDNGKTFGDVAGVLPLGKGQTPLEPSGKYERKVDRDVRMNGEPAPQF